MKKLNEDRFIRIYKKPLLYSSLLGFILLIISSLIISIIVAMYKQYERESMLAQLEIIKSNVNGIQKATDLEAFNLALQITDNGEVGNLDSIGQVIMERNKFISGIEIVPQGIIQAVYPYEQHKDALGLNILTIASAKQEALATIKSKKIFYAGPIPLRQGGIGIIARLPIFIKGDFWGFSAILIDIDAFFQAIKLYEPIDENLHVTFTKRDSIPLLEGVWNKFEGDYSDKLVHQFDFSNWEVSVFYSVSAKAKAALVLLILSALFLSFIAAYLLFDFLKRPILLKQLLHEKSKELIKQNTYFSSLVNAIPDFVFIINREGVVINFHSANLDGLMDEPKNFIGKNINIYFDQDLAKRLIGKINFTINNNEITSHTYSLMIKGVLEFFEARIVKINIEEALVFVRKITKLINANKKLQQSENQYRQLVQQAPDCIFQTDSKGRLLSFNRAGYLLTGFKSEDLVDKHIDQFLKFKDDQIKILQFLKSSKIEAKEAFLISKDGREIPVEISASTTHDGSILGITRDITERKKYINSIEEQNNQLKEIAWIQSHEVRAPLVKILSLIEFMKYHNKDGAFNQSQFLDHLETVSMNLDDVIKEVVSKSDAAVRKISHIEDEKNTK